jgi:hypothetical protein
MHEAAEGLVLSVKLILTLLERHLVHRTGPARQVVLHEASEYPQQSLAVKGGLESVRLLQGPLADVLNFHLVLCVIPKYCEA